MSMKLTPEEQDMLDGKHGKAAQKSMEILTTLGEIFGAECMVDVYGVQIAGVSYANLGEAGLEFLSEMAEDGKVKVLTTLNPAGMDRENWRALGINEEFAKNQIRVRHILLGMFHIFANILHGLKVVLCVMQTPSLALELIVREDQVH